MNSWFVFMRLTDESDRAYTFSIETILGSRPQSLEKLTINRAVTLSSSLSHIQSSVDFLIDPRGSSSRLFMVIEASYFTAEISEITFHQLINHNYFKINLVFTR